MRVVEGDSNFLTAVFEWEHLHHTGLVVEIASAITPGSNHSFDSTHRHRTQAALVLRAKDHNFAAAKCGGGKSKGLIASWSNFAGLRTKGWTLVFKDRNIEVVR